jgi:hypothetical protein
MKCFFSFLVASGIWWLRKQSLIYVALKLISLNFRSENYLFIRHQVALLTDNLIMIINLM